VAGDITHLHDRAAELAEAVDDPLAPPIRHAREKRELDRIRAVIADHQAGAGR
jgi:hypothetical protein